MEIKFMSLAIEEAKKAIVENEVPIGAVITKNNEVIACGYNIKEKNRSCIFHAEINAILEANKKLNNWRLDDCDIYITCEPCPMCASAIRQSRIKNVYYLYNSKNVNNNNIISLIFNDNYANKSINFVKLNESDFDTNLLSKFFENRR